MLLSQAERGVHHALAQGHVDVLRAWIQAVGFCVRCHRLAQSPLVDTFLRISIAATGDKFRDSGDMALTIARGTDLCRELHDV